MVILYEEKQFDSWSIRTTHFCHFHFWWNKNWNI